PENTPDLGALELDRLVFELNTLPLEQQHYIWAMIGLRYLPSVVYRVRMLMIFEQDVVGEVPNIKEITTISSLKEVND
ncbi:MAG TPA: Pvc16 family protein, partial [Bacillota bacterium]|nr:Pvc16 family protein [Bacillota bacterium]